MRSIIYSIFTFILISNCTLNKVLKHHGVYFLENKHSKLTLHKSNKNDITEILGPPSTKSTFDNDIWIYIERTTSSSRLSKLGKKTLIKNNVLILEIDSKGLLTEKIFLNKEDMNALEFSKDFTEINFSNQSFVYSFLNSMREKMNDPLGKKRSR